MQYIFLSHDVDWRKQGPEAKHIVARKERFDPNLFEKTPLEKMYYNFPKFIEIEEKFAVKSTFFFRTQYENGDYNDYHDEIKNLIRGGWEIGLHTDPSSIREINKIKEEKIKLERITNSKIYGNRVHYLSNDKQLQIKLSELDFVYDSSNKKNKDRISIEDMGYQQIENIIEFPITIMDAYLFTYMKIPENKIVSVIEKTLGICRQLDSDFNVMTILWHDNVLKMKGGRMYEKILEFLSKQDDVMMCTGKELADKIMKNL